MAVGGALLIGIGAYLTGIHHAGGVAVLVVGVVDTLMSFAIVPVARRRARKGLPNNRLSMDSRTVLSMISTALITPGFTDALDHQFGTSSIVFIALGCATYIAAFVVSLNRRKRRRTDRGGRPGAKQIGDSKRQG